MFHARSTRDITNKGTNCSNLCRKRNRVFPDFETTSVHHNAKYIDLNLHLSSCSFWNSARHFRSSFANSRKVIVYYSYGYSWYNDNVLIACLFHIVENWSILNETTYIQGVSKILEYLRKLEIPEIILSNAFFFAKTLRLW